MSDAKHDDHDDHAGHHGSPFIQHHYDDGQHQFDSGKLAIWFFLVQEVLFFSGLFVAYILYRNHRPEIFAYAHRYLDVKWGAINTCVLIISSLTAAWSVRCAQLNQRRGLILTLSLTIACAFGFLGIKYVEYMHKVHEHILFGKYFDPCVSPGGAELLTNDDRCPGIRRSACHANIDQQPDVPGWQVDPDCKVEEATGHWVTTVETATEKDPATGKDVTKQVKKKTWTEDSRKALPACEMKQVGHHPAEAENPPCWEPAQNPWVCKPEQVAGMVHYNDDKIRGSNIRIEMTCKDGVAPAKMDFDKPLASHKPGEVLLQSRPEPSEHELEWQASMRPPPPHTNMFFSIYFAMTGLHGIHVLAGILVYMWLLRRAIRGDFTSDYFGPVDYAALYWHLVDLIWIFLFPLLYLIH